MGAHDSDERVERHGERGARGGSILTPRNRRELTTSGGARVDATAGHHAPVAPAPEHDATRGETLAEKLGVESADDDTPRDPQAARLFGLYPPIVASSTRRDVGAHCPASADRRIADALRIPIRLDSHAGEVIVERPADGEAISPKVARALIDLMIDQASVVARLPNQYELKNKFIHDLLLGAIADDADILREGQVLGMDFTPPRAVVLIDASDYILRGSDGPEGPPEFDGTGIRTRAQHVIASVVRFFNLPSDTICGYVGNGEVVLLKASTTQDLVDWMREDDRIRPAPTWANLAALKRAGSALLARVQRDTRTGVSIGIGRYHPGIRGLSQSYRDASLALTLGKRLHGQDRVHCLDGIGIAAFVGVSDEATKIDLARHLLRPLDGEPELLRTLEAFFAQNCSASQCAARLGVHRNTLGYRLERISTLLDLDPRVFDDAVQLRVALLLRAFHPDG